MTAQNGKFLRVTIIISVIIIIIIISVIIINIILIFITGFSEIADYFNDVASDITSAIIEQYVGNALEEFTDCLRNEECVDELLGLIKSIAKNFLDAILQWILSLDPVRRIFCLKGIDKYNIIFLYLVL